ncbi:hypothetical protein [Nodosilinea sp. FACHB-13]|nr:hypothetical protein [Nodosilinea sp. FACHB-13]
MRVVILCDPDEFRFKQIIPLPHGIFTVLDQAEDDVARCTFFAQPDTTDP